jgi:hypothetical protein
VPHIEVDATTHDKVLLLASAWGATEGAVVSRLLDEFARRVTGRSSPSPSGDSVAIHAIYERVRTEALYHRPSGHVEVTSGPLRGRNFKTPSGAATAIVHSINSSVRPNRNGWGFFIVTQTGELLQTLRQ